VHLSIMRCVRRPAFALIAIAATACTGDRSHADSAEPELPTEQVTIWQDGFELFLEHPILIVDEPARFAAHVTSMATWLPRSQGRVTFEFTSPTGQRREIAVEAPTRPGIYQPEPSFSEAGEWRARLRIPDGSREAELELPPLRVHATLAEAEAAEIEEPPDGITFLKEQQWKLPMATATATRRSLAEGFRVPGTVRAAAGRSAAIRAPVAGRVLAAPDRAWPALGQLVHAGETVALLAPNVTGADLLAWEGNRREVAARAADLEERLASAESDAVLAHLAHEKAESVVARARKLAVDQAKSASELEAAEIAERSTLAQCQAAERRAKGLRDALAALAPLRASNDAELSFPTLPVHTPIDGVITRASRVAGEFVEAGAELFDLVDPRSVLVQARLPEADRRRFLDGTVSSIVLPGEADAPIPVDATARPTLLPELDERTRTHPLLFEIGNEAQRLIPGTFVDVVVTTRRRADVIAIPESALLDEDGRPIAYVQVSGETVQKRELTLGVHDSGWVEVAAGIAEGEQVVTGGAMAVRLASLSSVIPAHGHVH